MCGIHASDTRPDVTKSEHSENTAGATKTSKIRGDGDRIGNPISKESCCLLPALETQLLISSQ